MKINALKSQKRGFTLVELLVVIAIIATLSAIVVPATQGAIKKADRLKCVKNAQSVVTSLYDFSGNFDGEFPNEYTAKKIGLDDEEISKAYQVFQQLIESDVLALSDAEILYSKAYKTVDPDVSPFREGSELSEEYVTFGYTSGLSTTSAGNAPLIYDRPVEFEAGAVEFSTNVWPGRTAVIARVNGSAAAEVITAPGGAEQGTIIENVDGEQLDIFQHCPNNEPLD